MLTDDQCNKFRSMNLSFNDMVREIYRNGYNTGLEVAALKCRSMTANTGQPGMTVMDDVEAVGKAVSAGIRSEYKS